MPALRVSFAAPARRPDATRDRRRRGADGRGSLDGGARGRNAALTAAKSRVSILTKRSGFCLERELAGKGSRHGNVSEPSGISDVAPGRLDGASLKANFSDLILR